MNQPNIVLIMTDQHRADHVGWATDSRFALPNIDRLAESLYREIFEIGSATQQA